MNYIAVKFFLDVDKDSRIIHIVRDPRTFITSQYNWQHTKLTSFIANNVIPFWHPVGFFTKEYSVSEWCKLSKFEKFCWYWKYENEIMLKLYKGYHNFISIKFEDLFIQNTELTIKRILGITGLPYKKGMSEYFSIKQNISKSKYFPSWEQWPSSYCSKMDLICHEMMKKYDYGLEKEWLQKLSRK